MFADRLRKNLRTQGRWARREGIHCYRLYDADMPEFALAVDLYRIESGGEALRAHVQEYAPPAGVRPSDARARLEQALAVIPQVLDIPAAQVSFRVRRRQRAGTQYERAGGDRHGPGALHPVVEGGCRFLVNFGEYIDTGLFLDHRPTRALLCRLAAGGRFLNLFAYTATATVCAAAGGARSTTSVDLSATYLDWARRNLELNGFKGARHELIQADVLRWLPEQAGGKRRYDLVFLDPPTFSNSKRMRREFDVQRDHPILIGQAARLLAPGGVLVFSTHARRFRLRPPAPGLAAEEITRETIPRDFARNPRIHRCWKMTPAPGNDK